MCREQRISILTCDLVRFVFALICRSVVCRLSLVKSKPTSKEVLAGIELPEDVGVEMGGGGGGECGVMYLSLHCHHRNLCIKTGSDGSHFNV